MRKNAQSVAAERELVSDAPEGDLSERARELYQRVREETRAHPFRTVGWAASAGFVLGGGLFTPLTGRTLRAGLHVALRLAVLPALTRGLGQLASRYLDDTTGYRSTNEAEDKS